MSTTAGASAVAPRPDAWQRNVFAVTAASFMGYTGFTLVMPFLPLFIGRLGVTDVGQIAMWTGVSLGITPALTALLSPAWGRLGDRFGRKIMVERSLVSFVVLMTAMAFVTQAWHVLAIRAVQGLFAGYGSLSVAMAAESAPRDRMPNAIGLVQTAQRIGPGVGPVVGGILAGLVDLRRVFLLTAGFYAAGLVIVHVLYDDRATHAAPADATDSGRVTFRDVLAFQNFVLMLVVIFGLQFVDRSFGPVLPLWVEQTGVAPARVALTSGVLFSIIAVAGALGHHFCGRLLRRYASRAVIAGGMAIAAAASAVFGITGNLWIMTAASLLFGVGIGAAMTASYSAAGAVIPPGAHGAGFGVLTSASLVGMASSPFIAGFVGGASLRIVFFVDAVVFAVLAVAVRRLMTADASGRR
ncbi:MAG: MFS transporter [Acidobacteria bacterium]|nr:MFS transporter [Acidobacteriota bacterium]